MVEKMIKRMLGLFGIVLALVIFNSTCPKVVAAPWQVGTPIATYFCGPNINDYFGNQYTAGNFNLVWVYGNDPVSQLDLAQRYGLRAQLEAPILKESDALTNPVKKAAVDALIASVKNHPALYSYFIKDEPYATEFSWVGDMVAYLRTADPAHLAYVNLFPMGGNYAALGLPDPPAPGDPNDTWGAYAEYLHQFILQVNPAILSFDRYHFYVDGDECEYFVNFRLIREAAMAAGIPFMTITQACAWESNWRTPNVNEMRWENYVALAYGAQALSYYVYSYPKTAGYPDGMMLNADNSTTPQYAAAQELNPQFVAVAAQLQPLCPQGYVYWDYLTDPWLWSCVLLPENAPFYLNWTGMSEPPAEGMLLSYFGRASDPNTPTHVLVVNLNYSSVAVKFSHKHCG
jgi:hypothetical protein